MSYRPNTGGGSGDMLKSVYDTNNNGNLYVDDFEEYLKVQSETADAAGHIWEIYYEVTDENL